MWTRWAAGARDCWDQAKEAAASKAAEAVVIRKAERFRLMCSGILILETIVSH
jgi:hypothetical protein